MIKTKSFVGEVPILENHLLQDNASGAALNCKYNTGGITPIRGHLTIDGATQRPLFNSIDANTQSIYTYDNGDDTFLLQSQDPNVSFVSNPLANDAYNRVYWTDSTGTKFVAKGDATTSGVYPTTHYDLGVPAPTTTPDVNIIALNESSGGLEETAFVYTFVSKYGEEGAPSFPTGATEVYDGTELTIVAPTLPVSFNIEINKYRVYMLSGGYYLLLAEQVIASDTTVTLSNGVLGEAISTIEYALPPTSLAGLTAIPGGFVAGFFDNTLCFSESFLPYAWPTKYQLPFEENIVGIVATYNGLLVATDGRPYVVSGTSPYGMSAMPLDITLPCVSSRSLVDMGEFALYASPDGIVAMEGGNASLISKQTFSQKQWEELSPETMQCYRQDNNYLIITSVGDDLLFDPSSKTVTSVDFGLSIKACTYDMDAKLLALTSTNTLVKLDAAVNDLSFSWQSKTFNSDSTFIYTTARVRHTGTITFKLTYLDADDNVTGTYTKTVTNNNTFRLPANRAERMHYTVSGDGTVSYVGISPSHKDI